MVVLEKTEEENTNRPNITQTSPAVIKQNISTVTAEIISKDVKNENDFVLNVKILDVETNPNYESIAVSGKDYQLTPAFYLDENREVADNEGNRNLKDLAGLNMGDRFKADISFSTLKGWSITKVYK